MLNVNRVIFQFLHKNLDHPISPILPPYILLIYPYISYITSYITEKTNYTTILIIICIPIYIGNIGK